MSELISGISKLNPFKSSSEDDDDFGDEIDFNTIAGGGHAARWTQVTKTQLRVSRAMRAYLVHQKVLHEGDAGLGSEETSSAIKEYLDKSHIHVPPQLTDRDHALQDYFISSSHNTYLMAHQLYGKSSASAYELALRTGARCVEIDAWDNEDNMQEPKVTHGYTLVSHIPFRAVCETIRDVVDREAQETDAEIGYRPAPIMLSLENHCSAAGQIRLVEIMREVWGNRLLSKAVRDKGTREQEGTGEHVTLAELGSKICVIVEYHLPTEAAKSPELEKVTTEERQAEAYRKEHEAMDAGAITPELAELGVYAQSVKPVNDSWFETTLEHAPHDQLINVSESGLTSLMPTNSAKIARHNSQHLMRVYPKGTRISSANLRPVPFWGVGAQICALNWQTFNASAQVNEALFSGTDGYVLKPAALRRGGTGELQTGKKQRLRLHVAGATDIPVPSDRSDKDDIKPYLTCTLVHPEDMSNDPPKRKTAPYKHHKLGVLHRGDIKNPPVTDPIWDEVLEWEYDANELVFLRMLIKSDDAFAANPTFCVGAVRLLYVTPGWNFIRMLDLKGRETKCTILVRFEIEDALFYGEDQKWRT